MKAWDAFFPYVLPSVSGVSMPLVRQGIKQAAREFCNATRAWVVELDATYTFADTLSYDMELPNKTELVRIESATLNGEDYQVHRPHARIASCDRFVFTTDGIGVVFNTQPAPDLPLVLTCALEPADDATGVEDVIFRRYAPVIGLGAVAVLSSDAVKRDTFERRCDAIKTQLWRGNAAVRPRSRASFF